VLIAATGNYGFFNLLTALLCLWLLDDGLLRRLVPAGWTARFEPAPRRRPTLARTGAALWTLAGLILFLSGTALLREMVRTGGPDNLPRAAGGSLRLCDQLILSWAEPILLRPLAPLRTINGYGLFRVMTTERREIILEGSDDGVHWEAYEFRWKPGEIHRRPRFVAPHMPRLDWQMWFAALHPRGHAYWLERLMQRVLEGSPEVLDLLGENPFPARPPRFVRLEVYRYEFTGLQEKRTTAAWWRRQYLGALYPPLERQGQSSRNTLGLFEGMARRPASMRAELR
jgi:hypothetical protein